MNTSKNAYEIRLEILKEAIGLVQYKRMIQADKDAITTPQGNVIPSMRNIEAPSAKEITEFAEQLYKFVNQEK